MSLIKLSHRRLDRLYRRGEIELARRYDSRPLTLGSYSWQKLARCLPRPIGPGRLSRLAISLMVLPWLPKGRLTRCSWEGVAPRLAPLWDPPPRPWRNSQPTTSPSTGASTAIKSRTPRCPTISSKVGVCPMPLVSQLPSRFCSFSVCPTHNVAPSFRPIEALRPPAFNPPDYDTPPSAPVSCRPFCFCYRKSPQPLAPQRQPPACPSLH